MARIYISSSQRDANIASQFTDALKSFGHEVSSDAVNLQAGQEWRTVLVDALRGSDGFVVLLTPNSLSSQYVLTEIGSARAFIRESERMFLIPVIIGEMQIPPIIQDLQCVIADPKKLDEAFLRVQEAISVFMGRRAAKDERAEEVRQRIEQSAANYVQQTLTELGSRESRNRFTANVWYIMGFATLVGGVIYAGLGVARLGSTTGGQYWYQYIALAIKSVVVIALLIAASKYSFNLGKADMEEALKNSDRIHAISFGRFYLAAFGDDATWDQLKEVFQHWNIDKGDRLSQFTPDQFDPKFMEAIIELAKIMGQKKL